MLPKLQQGGWRGLGPSHFCGKRQEVLVLLQDSWQMTLKSYCGLVGCISDGSHIGILGLKNMGWLGFSGPLLVLMKLLGQTWKVLL